MGYPTDGVDNQGWKLYITSLVMIIAAGLFVIARCLARFTIHKLGSDDIAIVASLVRHLALLLRCLTEVVGIIHSSLDIHTIGNP
jgi:hypothetical protein